MFSIILAAAVLHAHQVEPAGTPKVVPPVVFTCPIQPEERRLSLSPPVQDPRTDEERAYNARQTWALMNMTACGGEALVAGKNPNYAAGERMPITPGAPKP